MFPTSKPRMIFTWMIRRRGFRTPSGLTRISFPTIFALGIFGLGQRAKRASSFLVMAIMGGAILPKVMGAIADMSDLSRAFIVPMVCFGFISVYAYLWPRLSGSEEGMRGVSATGGH